MRTQIKPANAARRVNIQKPGKEMAAPALRAAAKQG
jgi:hypothetical protein